MADEKTMEQRILERAEECHLDRTIINCILRMTEDEKAKLPDLLKAADYILGLKGKAAEADAVPVMPDVDMENMANYTEKELLTMQAQLERYLREGADGDATEEPPPCDRRSQSDKRSPSGVQTPTVSPSPKPGDGAAVRIALEDFLHG